MTEDHQSKGIVGFHDEDLKDKENYDNAVCSTPKGKKFKIPETLICPPAPKKRRLMATCSLKRRHVKFFSPPELEVFFLCAFTNNI